MASQFGGIISTFKETVMQRSNLHDLYSTGEVSIGIKGEVVSQFLLIKATDGGQIHTVKDYIYRLIGAENISAFEKLINPLHQIFKGFINSNHFILLEYMASVQNLFAIFTRRGAVVLKNDQTGIDLIVPVALPAGSGRRRSSGSSFELSKADLTLPIVSSSITNIVSYAESDKGRLDLSDLNEMLDISMAEGSLRKDNNSNSAKRLKSKDTLFMDVEDMSYIIIQCKNYSKGSSHKLKTF